MKLIVLIISTFIAFQSFGQCDDFFVDKKTQITYFKSDSSLYTGICEEFYRNGNKKYECVYEDGIVQASKTWFKNGQLKDSTQYIDGCYRYNEVRYYKNGNLKEIGQFYWDSIKNPRIKVFYQDGLNIYFDKEGKRKWAYENVNDSIDIFIRYKEDKLSEKRVTSKKGYQFNDTTLYYRTDGSIEILEIYKKEKQILTKEFAPEGFLNKVINFKDGIKINATLYATDGFVKEKWNYRNDAFENPAIVFDRNGNKFEVTYHVSYDGQNPIKELSRKKIE